MKKILCYTGAFLLSLNMAYAQEQTSTDKSDTLRAWSITGQHTLMLNQASFSNWVGGGANNVGWLAGVNYNFTYEKGKDLWESNVILGYGQNNTQGIGTRKTQDVINLNTNYGREFAKNWYLSGGVGFASQFAAGYEDGNNPSAKKISNWMSPGYLNIGVGVTYKPSDQFRLTLRPANARWTFVTDPDLQVAGNFGLKHNGDSSLFQFGFLADAYYKIELMKNITLENRASVFSNYLDHPERLVLAYDGILNMKVNKYISANLTLGLRYDHNQIKKTQLKQTLGVGFAYNFDNGVKRSKNKRNTEWKLDK